MKMIEGLKEKKLNPKKVASIISNIQKYSSIPENEKFAFDSEKEQRDHILSEVQSAVDLLKRRAKLKVMIDKTNIETTIRIPKGTISPEETISIAEALMFKLNYKENILIFNALNKDTANSKLRHTPIMENTKPTAHQLYDENFKNNSLKDLQMKLDFIDAHLEMMNATTDIIE